MRLDLYPTTVLVEQREDPITPEELSFIEEGDFEFKLAHNYISTDDRVLEKKEFSSVKRFIQSCLDKYMEEIFDSPDKLVPTISWINVTQTTQDHPRHDHCNSFLSGVFYFTDAYTAPINFYNPLPIRWDYTRNNWNINNSDIWSAPVPKNSLVLFPSYTFHEVLPSSDANNRISLAFNSFFESEFGSVQNKTRLAHPLFFKNSESTPPVKASKLGFKKS